MPFCEECKNGVASNEIHEDASTKTLLCANCAEDKEVVMVPSRPQILGRDFDYDVSYNRKGLSASMQLGGAKLSLQVSQDEITRVLGPEK